MPKNKTGFKLKASILALAMLGAPLAADAAGIGKITVLSALGQPLRAEIELSATKDELSSLTAKLGTPEQFRQQGVEYSSALGGINLSVEKRGNGQAYVRMSSDRPVNEPFLDVLIELSWASGKLLREYTFLLDPPDLVRRAPAPVAVPEVRSNATVSPVMAERVEQPVRIEPAPKAEKPSKAAGKQTKSAPVKVADEAPAAEKAPVAEKAPAPEKIDSNSGVTREVKRGDTLAKIASESAHDGVSLDQMLVSIFSANKDAFSGENMNRLKTGKILTIPTKEEAASVSDGEARKAIAVHSSNFNAYRKKLAEAAAAAPAADTAASQSASGKIAPKVEDKAPVAATGKDKLEISRTELGKDGKAAAKSAEDKIAKERELKEAKSRIAELEKNVAQLKAMESKTMAEAEKKAAGDKAANDKKLAAEKLAAEKAAADKAAADKLAAEKAAAEKAAADKAAADKLAADKAAADKAASDKAEADKLAAEKAAADKAAADKEAADKAAAATAAAPAEGAAPAEVAAAPAEAAPPPPKKKVVLPPPEPEPEPSFVEDNPGIVFGGAGLLAALAGFFGLREYRRRKGAAMEQTSQFGEPSAMSSVFGATGGESVDTRNVSIGDSISQSSMAGGDGAAGVDPVAEAEVYMAYGRDAQAEEILIEAMKNEPQRHAIHLKLLELYAARKSARPFETVAEDLLAQTGGSGAIWEKAVAMGRALDPNNPLYSAAPPIATPPVAAPAPADTGSFDSFGTSTVIMPPGQLAKMAAAEPAQVADTMAMPAMAEPELAAAAPALDFDLDLGSAAEEASGDAPVLDFDLDLGADTPAVTPATESTEIGLDLDIQSINPPPASAPALDVEFELDMPSTAAPAVEAPPSVDFDFNLDSPAEVAPTIVPEPIAAPTMDFGAINLDLEDVPSAAAPSMPDFTPPPGADENPEVATKIELAQAYEEMGDKEGMRELLQEVLAEGNAAQQDLARNKLAQHGL